jgi:hypothetical protein
MKLLKTVFIAGVTAASLAAQVVDTNSQHFYLCTYFINGQDQVGARLALSSDGINWELFNKQNPVIVPYVGMEGLMRDPMIFYDSTTQTFHMVWTSGWNEQNIGYANSKDLITWSTEQALWVGLDIPNCGCCWAPEIFFDDQRHEFMIFWSTETGTNGKRGYYTLTSDFNTFIPAKKLFDPGYSVIDETMLKVRDSLYYMFFKDEREAGEAGRPTKNIHYVYGPTPHGPWSPVSSAITKAGIGCEGPCALKVANEYRVYFDPFTDFNSTYRMVKVDTADLNTTASPWPQGDTLKTGTSIFQYNHANFIEIPRQYAMHLLHGGGYNLNTWLDTIPHGNASSACGCGSGAGLSFFPPLWFKVKSYRKRKKKKQAC